ncbi:Uncharacterised protein [Vibrio cholerae]|nr:Uncharacterised protein [Vibrio cholerae]
MKIAHQPLNCSVLSKKWLSSDTKLHWMILSQAMIGKHFYLISRLSNLIFVSCLSRKPSSLSINCAP